MARGARGVTCRTCGCLNFSSEHEECDKCRSKTAVSRRSDQAKSHTSASTNRLREDAVHSNGKKRRYEETKNTSKKRPQPDVIDLISDDEEDQVVVQKATSRREKENHGDASGQRELFQSRVFPTVFFKESDFPSMEQVAVMRKHAADGGAARSHPAAANAVKAVVSQPMQVIRPAQAKPVDPKSVEPRPPPADKKEQGKAKLTDSGEATGIEAPASTAPTDAAVKNAVQLETGAVQVVSRSEEEDPFFQSRAFDAVEFQASDFVTVFDGLAVARRSQPPALKANSSASSKATSSTSVGPAAATVSAGPSANEVMGLEAPSTAPPDTTKTPISEAKPAANAATNPIKAPGVLTVPSLKTVVAAPAAPTPAQSSAPPAPPPSSNPPRPASKPDLVSPTVAVLPPAVLKPTPVHVAPTFSKPAQGSSAVMPTTSQVKTKVAAVAKTGIPPTPASPPVPTEVAQTAMISGVPSISLSVPAAATSRLAPVTTNPSTNAAAIPYSSAEGIAIVKPAATKVSSPTNRNADMTKAGTFTNVLLPKKKHPEGMKRTNEAQQRTKPSPIVTDSADGDAVLFVKVNAAPLEMTPVEPPILGYCSPEFLAFMRECGDEDAEEDDDPEEVSRSQLKLLDVVDLTNLSDSEDSDAESPMPTPRASVATTATLKQGLPANTQMKGTGLPVAIPTTPVSGNRTWYVPTLGSERTRTRPEKVMCELCEETGLPSRLVRCPTCTKYFHRKCARENGDENVCWNCELGSMIDDSELDEEHAKHNSEYLAYLRAIRRSASPDDGEGVDEEEEEQEEDDEHQDGESEDATGDGDVEMASPAEGGEDGNPVSDEISMKSAGTRWKEFIGGATADVEASYHEVTKRIAEELRDEEKRQIYSRGFVSRDEFEAQMAEVEEYYISEEARLQQLEREKALEGRKAAEARRAQAAAEQAALGSVPSDEPPADRPHTNENTPPSVSTTGNVAQPVASLGAGMIATSAPPPVSAAATTQSVAAPSNTPAVTATAAPSAAPVASHPTGPPWAQFYETFTTAFKAPIAKPTSTTASPAAQP
ncbi:Chromatin assembly factor 1, subunit A [Phytophthora ramorum]